jgi:Flp pilus assembly protein TadB
LEKEHVERMAREKAEKEAMREAMANNIVVWFPLIFIAFVMMLGGAPAELMVLFCTVALVAGTAAAIVTWKSAYKNCYEKCLAELSSLSRRDSARG